MSERENEPMGLRPSSATTHAYCFDCGKDVDAHKNARGLWEPCWQSLLLGGIRIVQTKKPEVPS